MENPGNTLIKIHNDSLTSQLIFGFGRLGRKTIYRHPRTIKKAGIVVISNTICTFLSLVQLIGWRRAMVVLTCSTNLQENQKPSCVGGNLCCMGMGTVPVLSVGTKT